MSEDRSLNADAEFGDGPSEIVRLLQGCSPDALEIDRQKLFFDAGFAAGAANRPVRVFWPLVAAAMLLVSIGLGATVYRQAGAVENLQTLLAAAKNVRGTPAAASRLVKDSSVDLHTKPKANDTAAINFKDRSAFDERSRSMQRLASSAPLPPGRLTALGWEQLPDEMRNAEWEGRHQEGPGRSPASKANREFDSRPPHPPTYFELLRHYQEG